ncbi:hypothetical protein [Nocardia albiluteola]|nr:hypothetical protein [Nocardia albiluteola]
MDRLSVVDEIFLRTHRGMGTPIALQGLWRTADRVPRELLLRVHAALRTGPLGRRVVRARVPGARPYWQATSSAHPLRLTSRPLREEEVLSWANGLGFDLDPEFGPGWRLAAAELADGGSLVSLTCSHALADGRGLAIAVDRALSGLDTGDRRGEVHTELSASQSDWADARRQWSVVIGGTARALRHGIPARPAPAPGRSDPASGNAGEASTCAAVLQIPAADWELAAAARGGTANTLFLYLTAQMLWDSGFSDPVIHASVPVDTRSESRVNNDMAMTEVAVTRSDAPSTLREKCRAAYEHHMSSPAGLPEEILQVLPARAAYALSRGAGERDILCSNIGTLPAALSHLGPHRCVGVAARAIHPGLTAPLPRTRLSAYLSRLSDTYTLSLISLDPDRIESPTALTELARTALDRADLPVTAW